MVLIVRKGRCGPVALAESQRSAIWDYGSGNLALMSGHGAHLAPWPSPTG